MCNRGVISDSLVCTAQRFEQERAVPCRLSKEHVVSIRRKAGDRCAVLGERLGAIAGAFGEDAEVVVRLHREISGRRVSDDGSKCLGRLRVQSMLEENDSAVSKRYAESQRGVAQG